MKNSEKFEVVETSNFNVEINNDEELSLSVIDIESNVGVFSEIIKIYFYAYAGFNIFQKLKNILNKDINIKVQAISPEGNILFDVTDDEFKLDTFTYSFSNEVNDAVIVSATFIKVKAEDKHKLLS